jgi:beta-lactamase regulating signal transducer with metallopeptidase domain
MILVLIEAALRSLLVGLVVAVGLRVFRVHNVVAQKTAWGLVLTAALAMPWLLRTVGRWQLLPASASLALPAHPMTLLEELQARILAKNPSNRIPQPNAWVVRKNTSIVGEESAGFAPETAPTSPRKEFQPASARGQQAAARKEAMVYSTGRREDTQGSLQPSRVANYSPVLFWSLYLGVVVLLILRLVFGLAATLRLWLTATPISPKGMGCGSASLRIRASPRVCSPLTIGSAILLPADYEAWDVEKLRIVLAHESSHIRQGDFYLQILAGLYASLVWFSPLGWWLKRELADLAEAISDRAGIEQAESRTSYAQILLEFAAAPRPAAAGVPMARSGSLSRRIERLLDDHEFRRSFAGRHRALVGVVLVPVACFAATTLVRVQAASAPPSAPIIMIAPTAGSATPVRAAAVRTLAVNATGQDLVAEATEPEAMPAVSTQTESHGSMTFDRTLSVSGEAQLMISTGSGDIHLTRSSDSQIHIQGQIHVSRDGSEEQAREIAAHPPIEQAGNLIRVGQQHEEHWRGISINYEIEAPAGTLLGATSGSGNIVDEGVGHNAKLETGSGDITARGLQGPFTVKTGSGNITAEQAGDGDVKAETGSGNIEIKDVHGSFHAQTGSGDIKATGTPSAPWTLETGSGNIDIWSGSAPLTLDGSTGSGSVITDHEMLVQGSLDRHHIKGNLNGGGPLVRAETGSGEIHVH